MDIDNFIDEIEEVSDVNPVIRLLVILFKDFLIVNVNDTILHVQLLVIHLILLADFTQSILKHEEELLTVQIFLIALIVVAPNRRVDLIELLLR